MGQRLGRVHVTVARRTGARRDDRLHMHSAPLMPNEIVMVDGLAVTSVARTVVDVARTAPFEPAVAVRMPVCAGRRFKPGQDPGDVVFAEKLREDAIRHEDLEVVRWTWADLDDFAPTAARRCARFRT